MVVRVGSTVESAEGVVARVRTTVDTADDLVLDAGGLIERVVPLVDFADSTFAQVKPVVEALLVDADLDVEAARVVATRMTEVLAWADKTIRLLEPIADDVLESVDPDEVKAVIQFIDHLPALGDSLENDVMPVLASLDTVAPEVHEIISRPGSSPLRTPRSRASRWAAARKPEPWALLPASPARANAVRGAMPALLSSEVPTGRHRTPV